MSVKVVQGDLFDSSAQTLVNTVNCVGASRRDPIMFGLISGSKKLYYICDWVTPDDDITLDKVIEILGKEIVESDFLKEKIESV